MSRSWHCRWLAPVLAGWAICAWTGARIGYRNHPPLLENAFALLIVIPAASAEALPERTTKLDLAAVILLVGFVGEQFPEKFRDFHRVGIRQVKHP